MKIALVGLPLSGKRTLFSLLTGRTVPESRKPGELIEGTAVIRDPRVEDLARICKPVKTTFATNIFVLCPDVAEGAAAAEWLGAVKQCDLLCAVVRAFDSDAVFHPTGSVDPERDLARLKGELLLADMEVVEKRLIRIEKEKRGGQNATQAVEEQVLRKCMAGLEAQTWIVAAGLTEHEQASIRSLPLVTRIPLLAVYNVAEAGLQQASPAGAVAISCRIEQEISMIQDAAERKEFLASLGLSMAGVDRANAAAYAALGLMSFYTVGPDEVRAWTIRRGSLAPAAGGKVHTDIERGFIRAEVIKFDDFMAAGGEKAAKESGKVQLRGRDYVIEDGDICHFLFNV